MQSGRGGMSAKKHRTVRFHSIGANRKHLHQEEMRVNRINRDSETEKQRRARLDLVYENCSAAVAGARRGRK